VRKKARLREVLRTTGQPLLGSLEISRRGQQGKAWVVDFDSEAVGDFEGSYIAIASRKKDFDRAVAAARNRLSRRLRAVR
jgi:RNase P protein component